MVTRTRTPFKWQQHCACGFWRRTVAGLLAVPWWALQALYYAVSEFQTLGLIGRFGGVIGEHPKMPKRCGPHLRSLLLFSGLLVSRLIPRVMLGGGVTVITHGYNGDVNGWITGMADAIPKYDRFPGTNFTIYTISVTENGGFYYLSPALTAGSAPSATDSGEIIVKLDWSQLAGGIFTTYSTYDVAVPVALGLLQTNLIPSLCGHALAELPLHLMGHSRGGSLISEISRLLGTNGVWVDHLTTLDPHPLNNDGFSDLPNGVDAPVRTYENVLFHDNYWQNLGAGLTDPDGEPVFGAYIHQLTSLEGGYNNVSSVAPYHSNVHLWYYGTIDFGVPASDTEASIGFFERTNWWNAYESLGVRAGFEYSRIGSGNRLSPDQPQGPGFEPVSAGYNQVTNRTPLTTNSGEWPNLLTLAVLNTNPIAPRQSILIEFSYQWAHPTNDTAALSIYLDDDMNPFNANGRLLGQALVPGTSSLLYAALTLTLEETNAPPGDHVLYAQISAGRRTRYLYAPQVVHIISNLRAPGLDISSTTAHQFQIGVNGIPGQTIVLQVSSDLSSWQPLATNTLTLSRWAYQDTEAIAQKARFYRAAVQ